MADKRISDFPTLEDAQDDDLLLVSSSEESYSMKVKTLKEATKKVAADAVTAANNAQAQASAAKAAASNAESDAASAKQQAEDLEKTVNTLNDTLGEKIDGAYVENGYLYAVTAGYITAPTKGGTDDTHYAFKDFGTLPTNIHKNETVIAQYTTTYRVRFMNGDVAFDTQWVAAGGSATTPTGTPTKASTAQYSYTFSSWSGSYTNITAPVDITATFTSTIRKYTVRFYNGTTLLQTVNDVPYGGTATFTGTTPVDPSGDGGEFEGWVPSNVGITGNTDCKAQFESALEVAEISDSWDEILASVANGTYKQKYKVGNYKPLDLGSEGIVNMQIAGIEKDDLADGSGKAPITWISKELLSTSKRMNPKRATEEGTGGIGGWEKCELRAYLIGTIMPLIPESVRSEIKIVSKTQNAYNISESSFSQTTQDAVWIPNYVEVFRTTSPYKTLFQNQDANRVKSKVGVTTASNWWLRNTADVRCFMYVTTSGGNGTSNAEFNQGVSFGFCT